MMDGGRVVGGIIIALVGLAGPVWVVSVRASSSASPLKAASGRCIESAEVMRRVHPQLLAQWREQAVRGGSRMHHSSDGSWHRTGLRSCISCHGSADRFCDKCHSQVGVSINCWTCHPSAR